MVLLVSPIKVAQNIFPSKWQFQLLFTWFKSSSHVCKEIGTHSTNVYLIDGSATHVPLSFPSASTEMTKVLISSVKVSSSTSAIPSMDITTSCVLQEFGRNTLKIGNIQIPTCPSPLFCSLCLPMCSSTRW